MIFNDGLVRKEEKEIVWKYVLSYNSVREIMNIKYRWKLGYEEEIDERWS